MSLREDIAGIARRLDAIGFDVGDYHVSLYRAVLMLLVVLAVLVAGRIGNAILRRTFRRMHRLDATQ